MKEAIQRMDPNSEFETPERCSIIEPEDLVFLAICTPRFRQEDYEDLEAAPAA